MKVQILKSKASGKGFHRWIAAQETPITREEAQEEQKKMGYHPAGYGFYDFRSGQSEGTYWAMWSCACSCD